MNGKKGEPTKLEIPGIECTPYQFSSAAPSRDSFSEFPFEMIEQGKGGLNFNFANVQCPKCKCVVQVVLLLPPLWGYCAELFNSEEKLF
ncbi:hypothetical protein EVAR_86751_1 [Eumeta japonica]|uniref:Uncharacterized protein n=1 Tax=Eumeta variegata TaxID=151549 RepID=A0A4C1VZR4_EUMVA|nr:hypothetical protein EVAR_86751_1 [Eumeta japonica]